MPKKKPVVEPIGPQVNYVRRAKVTKEMDGDTIELAVDLGFNNYTIHIFRLDKLNTDETDSTDPVKKAKAMEAKDWLNKQLPIGSECIVQSIKDKTEKFGRYLGVIWKDGVCLNDELIKLGLAKPYNGRGPK